MIGKFFSYRVFGSILTLLLAGGVLISSAFALSENITGYSKSTAVGSNSGTIETVGTGASSPVYTASGYTSVVNSGDDSSTVGNYFRGYYFDSNYGFFKLDWSADTTQNVRILESTDKCAAIGIGGYGYKIGGYAKSEEVGFIKFDYSSDIFVFYCDSDKKLHGYAYSDIAGFQNFEGISVDISGAPSVLTTFSDPFFSLDSIQGESPITDPNKEIFFYVIK